MTDHPGLTLSLDGLAPEQTVQTVIEFAARVGASDIFFATNDDHVRVSVSHLGRTHHLSRLAGDAGRRCVAQVKSISGLDISEKRRPQDGRMLYVGPDGRKIDLRVSVLPTLHGEDLTLRVLDRDVRLIDLDQLGLRPRDLSLLRSWLQNPGGLVLVTGPTGSGKTTTLYACLKHLADGTRKINTIEDPVEYALEGIRQSQVNPKLDLGFADLLRGVLRQAPGVIMIGEIRDPETAVTAVRAANSGHLVLATLHAPVAAGAVQAMLNLDITPYALATALVGVVSQRLIRTLCPACAAGFDLPDGFDPFAEVRGLVEFDQGNKLFQAVGCPECRGLGYSGRAGVFELMGVSPAVRTLILEKAPTQAFQDRATADGMLDFRRAALLKVAQGLTNQEEVFRAIPTEYLRVG